ncbi:uncharacterized protein ARMOST_08392 [Armillaria ostoyae]|uniref:Uncharacterized protein n=1 Tax=Armillaria ostoyae TaxID=47428 RepID=A0A284R8H0_ARMOS|nr:uncharacterized protein ARMOST_08392 [Armillaria ostoyae]
MLGRRRGSKVRACSQEIIAQKQTGISIRSFSISLTTPMGLFSQQKDNTLPQDRMTRHGPREHPHPSAIYMRLRSTV